MTKYVIVIPFIYPEYAAALERTLDLPADNILWIDNCNNENLGVAESWNRGIDFMFKRRADWLIIMGASMRFGPEGGKDMIRHLEENNAADIIHFTNMSIPAQTFDINTCPTYDQGCFYWHLTALSADTVNEVGYFDPNFYPVYYEDTDWDLRYRKFLKETDNEERRLLLPIDASSEGLRHGVEKAGVKVDGDRSIAYFSTKWGRHPGAKELGDYAQPFNNRDNCRAFFPSARGRQWHD